jgi:hypothetical protein
MHDVVVERWESEEEEGWAPEDREPDVMTQRERATLHRRPKLSLGLEEELRKELR